MFIPTPYVLLREVDALEDSIAEFKKQDKFAFDQYRQGVYLRLADNIEALKGRLMEIERDLARFEPDRPLDFPPPYKDPILSEMTKQYADHTNCAFKTKTKSPDS